MLTLLESNDESLLLWIMGEERILCCISYQKKNGELIQVCKTMFLHTLGARTDGILKRFVEAKARSPAESIYPCKEKRGRKKVSTNPTRDAVIEHINSFNPVSSHYRREHAPHRRYLEAHMTIQSMCKSFQKFKKYIKCQVLNFKLLILNINILFLALYQDFVSKGHEISYESYRQIFASENIGFGENRTDDCEVCLQFERHKHEIPQDHVTETCEICEKSLKHLQKAKSARQKYREDMQQPNAYAMDMQKVILIPKLTTKESFFVSRLVCFNETLASGEKGDKNFAGMWHEGISGSE